ncbi:sensor histidine kinase [Massilia arenae]|uniref:histidine kinase n=1 Tax=Massilia arenae TaxID=2603288 RepID=A0A5C7FLC5_9BURK|nr:HAMP domain-containing sensor histidine kinase [Massilia arenae]TXF96124.1 HAMP domain-containing histidine kinase [Massilia arenae]
MGSRAGIWLALAGMLALAFGAGTLHESPRLQVSCALAALPLLALLWRCVERLARARQAAPVVPEAGIEQRALLDNALAFEARLEHAPIALFGVDAADGAAPLNASARKLVAPGRALDADALYRQLAALDTRRRLIEFDTERGVERALVAVSMLTLHGASQRLVALMPVESELEAEALKSWRQLVHVLTHEIMNSLTPVASLSRTARDLLSEFESGLPSDVGADLKTALEAINRRADSLVDFVASYRSLSNVPPARPERVALADLFERVDALVGPVWRARGGDVTFAVEPASLELMADPGQLEQALINLLKNAFEATQPGGQARVDARLVRGSRLRIEIADDGAGIPEASVPHIFTPFYTTKKQGGGIGLAMVRHLVHENGGTVRYARSVGKGARFVISF